jgi:hypothetical protein
VKKPDGGKRAERAHMVPQRPDVEIALPERRLFGAAGRRGGKRLVERHAEDDRHADDRNEEDGAARRCRQSARPALQETDAPSSASESSGRAEEGRRRTRVLDDGIDGVHRRRPFGRRQAGEGGHDADGEDEEQPGIQRRGENGEEGQDGNGTCHGQVLQKPLSAVSRANSEKSRGGRPSTRAMSSLRCSFRPSSTEPKR